MPDFPNSPLLKNQFSIGTHSPECISAQLIATVSNALTSTAWPAANLAIYIPVEIYEHITIAKMMVTNGTAVSGNIDVGIYNADGTKKVSAGTTAQTGTSALQIFDITDTLLTPGLYYMAVALDNTTGTLAGWNVTLVDFIEFGVFQQASAFVLPSPAVFAAFAQTFLPNITMTPRMTI